MRGSRNFRQGGGGGGGVQVSLTKKALTFFFLFFFLVLSLFYSSQMVNFKEIYHFSRFFFPGGSNFFQGGPIDCLFPIETHITCDFPGGGGGSGPPVPPSGSAFSRVSSHILIIKCCSYTTHS